MKKFSSFLGEAKISLAQINGKRLGYIEKNGSWYDRRTGEFEAKTENGNLTFYNQNQVVGKKDPKQNRPLVRQQTLAARTRPKVSEELSHIDERELREKYISGEIFKVNEWVENKNTGLIGKIIRRGTNYLICVTEDDNMFKSWIKDVNEWTNESGVTADKREVGTDELRDYAMKMTGTKKIDNFNIKKFINKYKRQKKVN